MTKRHLPRQIQKSFAILGEQIHKNQGGLQGYHFLKSEDTYLPRKRLDKFCQPAQEISENKHSAELWVFISPGSQISSTLIHVVS